MAPNRTLTSIFLSSFLMLCAVLVLSGRLDLGDKISFFRQVFRGKTATPVPALRPEDMDLFIRTVWGEARSEGYEGMCAVAEVILNRYRAESHSTVRLRDVILKDKQFSCWNRGDPNRSKLLGDGICQDPTYQLAQKAAKDALLGVTNFAKGATHYHAHTVRPVWSEGIKPCCFKGKHRFYTLCS